MKQEIEVGPEEIVLVMSRRDLSVIMAALGEWWSGWVSTNRGEAVDRVMEMRDVRMRIWEQVHGATT